MKSNINNEFIKFYPTSRFFTKHVDDRIYRTYCSLSIDDLIKYKSVGAKFVNQLENKNDVIIYIKFS